MNRDQWNNVFEFVKAFGDFDDHGAYDPDGGIFQNLSKLGCVFPMVICSAFRMEQYRVNDHPYQAPQFNTTP